MLISLADNESSAAVTVLKHFVTNNQKKLGGTSGCFLFLLSHRAARPVIVMNFPTLSAVELTHLEFYKQPDICLPL